MTFEDVSKIEAIRRQIEKLQVLLNKQATMRFGTLNEQNRVWEPLSIDLNPVLRETLCKHTVMQITELLDDAARLGVDVLPSKEVLLKVLEEIKPKQEEDHGLG
jgi:hypothetical protein